MASIPNIQVWVDFFDTLRELPELWKVKSDMFKDRNKKKNAWPKLLDVYKQIEPNANVDSHKKRLTNIRTCYQRELKKVEQNQRSGAGAEEEYVPSLWYFEALDFLRDQEVQISGVPTIDLEQDEVEVDQAEEASENAPGTSTSYSCSHKRKKTVGQHMAERNALLKEALGQLTKKETNKDDASVFAESWATSYRKLSPTQQIYAKRAIEDILILGQLDLLSLHSINSPSSNNSTAPSSASLTPLPLHHSSLQLSRSSTPFFQQSLSSPPYKNAIVIPGHVETDIYSNVQQLLSDNNFS